MDVAEASLANLLAGGVYSDGTGSGGKQVVGLAAGVPLNPTTGVYGSIDRSVWSFWRNQFTDTTGITAATIQQSWNTQWAKQVRGMDRPDLIIVDSLTWAIYMASLQAIQRITDTSTGDLGFPSVKFMDADVVLDGGIGGFCPGNTAYFLNTKYIFWRPHSQRNMVPSARTSATLSIRTPKCRSSGGLVTSPPLVLSSRASGTTTKRSAEMTYELTTSILAIRQLRTSYQSRQALLLVCLLVRVYCSS
jgi:hypothetical protein